MSLAMTSSEDSMFPFESPPLKRLYTSIGAKMATFAVNAVIVESIQKDLPLSSASASQLGKNGNSRCVGTLDSTPGLI